jgi:hypothetical protein
MASHRVVCFPDNHQYEGGDVMIQTSHDPSGLMLVHSHVLSEGSEYFRAMFAGCGWTKSRTVRAADGGARKVWRLEMFFDRETALCLLTDDVSQ